MKITLLLVGERGETSVVFGDGRGPSFGPSSIRDTKFTVLHRSRREHYSLVSFHGETWWEAEKLPVEVRKVWRAPLAFMLPGPVGFPSAKNQTEVEKISSVNKPTPGGVSSDPKSKDTVIHISDDDDDDNAHNKTAEQDVILITEGE